MTVMDKNSEILLPLSALKRDKKVMSRDCGECVACCVYYSIKDVNLHKEALTPCPKLAEAPDGSYTTSTSTNCTIHDEPEMPKTCADFNCYWLLGHGNEEDRPDKSGIMIDRSKRIENSHESKSLWEGVEDTPEGRATIDRMSKSLDTPIIVLPFGELKIKRIVGRGTE